MAKDNQYNESSITVLKDSEPVKERPSMYTRTDSPTHICQEVIDNTAGEALGGFATEVDVQVHGDGSFSVRDNGCGIPISPHPGEGVPVVELMFTHLYAGGKFDKKDGGSAYAFSSGLHGVGISVTNALSTRLEVTVKREGKIHHIVFSGGDVIEPLTEMDKCAVKNNGTEARVWPDGKYFGSPNCSTPELERLLHAKAVLLLGVRVSLTRPVKGEDEAHTQTWHYPDSLKNYLTDLIADAQEAVPIFSCENYISDGYNGDFNIGEGAVFALIWLEEGSCTNRSYVNLVPTPLGGTHEAGLKQAMFNAVNNFINLHNLLPRGVKMQSDDVFSRTAFALSARVLDPRFQGQTKDKLTNRDTLKLVATVSGDPLELQLNQNVDFGKRVAELAIRQTQTRMRSVKKIEKKKGSGVIVPPGKLTDYGSGDIRESEFFPVEGDSVGGSARLARDKATRTILPLRGKVPNSFEVRPDQLLDNAEIHDISVTIDVDPHDISDNPDLGDLRYGRIAILSDTDMDGSHIRVLLLTLLYRHFPKPTANGHIYIVQPPLFHVDADVQGKSKPVRKFYILDQNEPDSTLERLQKEGVKRTAYSINRFRSLGEMNPDQLRDTTMYPDTRHLLQVQVPEGADNETHDIFVKLMGRGEAATRRVWMEKGGDTAELDI